MLLSLPLSNSGLNYLSRWFISLKSEDKKTLDLKLFQVWTNLTTVLLVEGKVRKLGLKLRIEKTKIAMHIWRQNFSKIAEKFFLDKFLKQTRKARFVLKSELISVQSGLV